MPDPSTDPRESQRLLAGRQVVAKILADEVKALTDGTRSDLEPQMAARESIVATLPDGTVIGQVGRSKASTSPKVTDEAALLAWVKTNRPDEIVQSVNTAYVDALKKQARQHGHAFDPDTGEVIPGIEVVAGSSSYTPRVDDGARDLVMPRLLDLIAGGLMPSLPAATANGESG